MRLLLLFRYAAKSTSVPKKGIIKFETSRSLLKKYTLTRWRRIKSLSYSTLNSHLKIHKQARLVDHAKVSLLLWKSLLIGFNVRAVDITLKLSFFFWEFHEKNHKTTIVIIINCQHRAPCHHPFRYRRWKTN